MFTIFDLFALIARAGCILFGIIFGAEWFGVLGAIVGGVVGFFIGPFIGQIPWMGSHWLLNRQFASQSNDDLRKQLHDPDCLIPNMLLVELKKRDEDIQMELPLVLDMMTSDGSDRRGFGWAALTHAFPDVASELSGYSPTASTTECQEQVQQLTNAT